MLRDKFKLFFILFLMGCGGGEVGVLMEVTTDSTGWYRKGESTSEEAVFIVKIGDNEKYCHIEDRVVFDNYKIFVPMKEGEELVLFSIGLRYKLRDKEYFFVMNEFQCVMEEEGKVNKCSLILPSEDCLDNCFTTPVNRVNPSCKIEGKDFPISCEERDYEELKELCNQ